MSINLQRYTNTAAFAIKEAIKKNAREDKQARLDACWNLLVNLHANGEMDFSTVRIGRALESHNIQRAQSYRNAQGKDYRDIVQAFASEMGLRTTAVRAIPSTPLDVALRSIQDLDVQVRVRSMFDDLNRLRMENNTLRHEMSRMHRGSSGRKADSEVKKVEAEQTESVKVGRSPMPPTGSLRGFLQDDWMAAHDLAIDSSGAVLCSGRPITLPGFARQLELLLGLTSKGSPLV